MIDKLALVDINNSGDPVVTHGLVFGRSPSSNPNADISDSVFYLVSQTSFV